MLQVFTGNGKGKTTAALGLAIRAVGAGKRVGIIYFDKGGESHYSEREILRERFAREITVAPTGLDRIDPKASDFRFGVASADKEEARRGMMLAREWIASKKFDLIILDEFNSAVKLGMIRAADARELVRTRPQELELVLTGRGALKEIIDEADLVTEMELVKHYFYSGTPARKGFDF